MLVENKPGANATTAGDTVAKAGPDGSLLWFAASPTVTISPNVMPKMPFDPIKDLTPVAPILSYYNVLVVNKDLPFKSVSELVDYAKANPGQGELRLGRRRRLQPPVGRAAGGAHRHQDAARAVQGQRARDDRRDRRPDQR